MSRKRRGFSVLVVIILVALTVMVGMTVLRLAQVDLTIVGAARRAMTARDTAEGGAREVLNDVDTVMVLPSLDDPDLQETYTVSPTSVFNKPGSGRVFQAQINFLRLGPVEESSHDWSRAAIYEIQVTSKYQNGASTAEVRAEVYRPVSLEPGIVLPRRHYR